MRKGGVRLNVFLVIHRTVRQWFGDGIFRRIFKNAGLLLGGRAASGVLSLATLSISARGLGVEQFGILVLVPALTQIKRHRGGFGGGAEKGSLTHGKKTPLKRCG